MKNLSLENLKKEMFDLKKTLISLKENQTEEILNEKNYLSLKIKTLMLIIDNSQKLAKQEKKNVEENHILQAIKKMEKQAKEALENGIIEAEKELDILKQYLPKMLSIEEIKTKIEEIISNIEKPNIGNVMKELKKFKNIDMKEASKIVKEKLGL